MSTIKLMMVNIGDYDARAEHAWLIASGLAVFSVNRKSDFSNYISEIAPDIVFINAVNGIREGIASGVQLKSKKTAQPFIVIFFSEYCSEDIQIKILKSGIDEYFVRTYSEELFREKIKIITEKYLLRIKIKPENHSEQEINIDREQYCIFVNQTKFYLPRLQFNLLELLMSQPEKIFTYQEIAMHLFSQPNKDKSIKVYISKIKKIIGNTYIKNIPEKGYVFNC